MPHPSHASPRHRASPARRGLRGIRLPWALLAAIVALTPLTLVALRPLPVDAAPVVGFNPGNIISDSVFYNSASMSAADVQAFLNARSGACAAGFTCLKGYAQDTPNRAADAYCGAYPGAARESAAVILTKVGQACGINPQVLLVMLQKEQGLVTSTAPVASKYDKAMGFGCPDTAACDTTYYGFFNQVYSAARQFRVYERSGRYTQYGPYKTVSIRYHPTVACGSSPVYVENQATASLYTYTPYQPNAAALAAGSGTGDACSAYGNRNFHIYFTSWFGSPAGFTVSGAIGDYWRGQGGASGPIGAPTAAAVTTSGGTYQRFVQQDLFQRTGGPVVPVRGSIRVEYRTVGDFLSGLGWPVGPEYSITGGAYQDFVGGRIFAKPGVGTFAIAAPFFEVHEKAGNVFGYLGWPVARAVPLGSGSVQRFERGTIYARDDESSYIVSGGFDAVYEAAGGPLGTLGWPSGGLASDRVGTHVVFDGGWIQATAPSTFFVVSGDIGRYYNRSGGIDGPLGPVRRGAVWHTAGGWSQEFTGGTVYTSTAGTFTVPTSGVAAVEAAGGISATGLPTGEQVSSGASWSQSFANLTLTSGPGGTATVSGAIGRLYRSMGGAASYLGAARGGERFVAGGYVQDFEGGQILCWTGGLVALDRRATDLYQRAGAWSGRLGWPIASFVSEVGGVRHDFQGGAIYASTDPGGPAGLVVGGLLQVYRAQGGPRVVGYPTGAEALVGGAWKQVFQRGAAYLPVDGRPGSLVSGRIWETFVAAGGDTNPGIGHPVGVATTLADGTVHQPFAAADLYQTSTGTFVVRGYLRTMYQRLGGVASRLGVATESERPVRDGFVQRFAGGTLYVSPAGGGQATWGAIQAEYLRRGGPTGPLGWPTGGEVTGVGRWSQSFQGGTLVLRADGTYTLE